MFKKQLTYGDLLEYVGFIQDERKKLITEISDLTTKCENLEEIKKQNLEYFDWIKEAFGECISEDYVLTDFPEPMTGVPYSLAQFIDDYLKETKQIITQ